MPHLFYINTKPNFKLTNKVCEPQKSIRFFISGLYVVFIFLISLSWPLSLCSQKLNLGIPPIQNYSKAEYGAGSQNWATLSHQGRLYFGNHGGLLVFDGVKWTTLSTPNNTIIRSIATDGGQKICIGAQGELGCFEPNEKGQLTYHSIIEKLGDTNKDFEEVWEIEFIAETLYAHWRPNEILSYDKDNIQIIKTNSLITNMVKINDEIFFHVLEEGIHKLVNNTPELLKGTESLKNHKVVDLLPYNNGILIITDNHGLYYHENGILQKWESNAETFLNLSQARCGLLLENGELLIGTHLGGVVRIGKDKNADLILDKKHGLQSNGVIDMCIAQDGSLWIATNSGLDRIDLESTCETFYPDGNLEGGVYDIEFWNDRIYFCTTNGVYSIEEKEYYNPFIERDFKLVEGSKGQSYNLDLINNELFCGHHNGAFKVDPSHKLIPILKGVGAWKFVKLNPETLALGTYEGIYILEKTSLGKWVVKRKVSDFNESSRVMLLDKYNHLWVSHPYKKVYRIDFNKNFSANTVKEYNKDGGFKSNNRNYIFLHEEECLLTNETGVYNYNEKLDTFVQASKFSKLYPTGVHVRTILEKDNVTWVISDRGTDRLTKDKIDDGNFELNCIIPGGTNEHFIGGFENLYPLDSNKVLVCSEKGAKLFKGNTLQSSNTSPMITSVSLPTHGDSIIYGGYGSYSEFKLDEDIHNINFEFTSPNALQPIQYYRYKLDGFDDDWSDWTSSQSKEYSNLDYGEYIFNVRTVNHDNSESEPSRVSFSIDTPWHQSSAAYLMYSLIFILSLLGLLLIPRSKYKQETAILAAEKESTEADLLKVKQQTERDLEKIRREKLESEIAFKNKELAMSTMYLLQKNETLNAIRSEVENVETSILDKKAKQELKKVLALLRSDIQLDEEWQNFSIHFDQVHHNFLKRLKSSYPKLTPNDQKLSAYLRMNLTTKEIAPLLKISIRGVEIARYRLRKKLELAKDINLNDFMMSY